jgi:hypothetical protein
MWAVGWQPDPNPHVGKQVMTLEKMPFFSTIKNCMVGEHDEI